MTVADNGKKPRLVGDEIYRWREYQIRSTTPWLEFIGKSRIVDGSDGE